VSEHSPIDPCGHHIPKAGCLACEASVRELQTSNQQFPDICDSDSCMRLSLTDQIERLTAQSAEKDRIIERLERERNDVIAESKTLGYEMLKHEYRDYMRGLEAERDRLRAALEQIASETRSGVGQDLVKIAREALAGVGEEK
jgi:hypothetical protein